MISENILRTNRQFVKDNFIKDFAAKDEDVLSYVKVSLPKSWILNKNKKQTYSVNRINVSDYEQTLIKFFENPDRLSTKHPLLIIVGGAGTGKSSSIKYALSKANICEGCSIFDKCDKKYPARIVIDYLSFKSEVGADSPHNIQNDGIQKRIDKFWHYLIKVLDKIIDNHLDQKLEISGFWHWLVGECKSEHSFTFYKQLYPKSHLFEHPTENSAELLKLRDKLYKKLTSEEIAYYKLCQIAYLTENTKVNCNILLFDNIDTIDPFLQVKLIDFAIEAYRLLGSKAIIPMRPYTFYLNKDASDFIEVIEHCLPSLKDVLNKRLELLKQKNSPEIAFAIENIITTIFSRNLMLNVYSASSGDSIRFGLRNLFNLFLSPVIVTHIDKKPLHEIQLDTNIFFQALFCSETNKEEMYERNFVNILISNRGPNEKFLSTIKLRALYFIYKYGQVEVKILYSHLENFGYEKADIIDALNDFLEIRKALVWSSSLVDYNDKTLQKGSGHIMAITPMGVSYFEQLLENSLYIRECIVELDSNREYGRIPVFQRTLSIIRDLFDLDMEEVEIYCNKKGISSYKSEYHNGNLSITLILWKKLLSDLQYIAKDVDYDFDVFNEFFIINKIQELFYEIESEKE